MTLAVCRKTIAEAQSRNMHIQALAIATQRSTAVLWDRQSGQALVPAMVWQDARYARTLADKAGEWDRPLLNHTGRPVGIRSLTCGPPAILPIPRRSQRRTGPDA
jgi:glycerol kinase